LLRATGESLRRKKCFGCTRLCVEVRVGQKYIHTVYICIYGICGREFTKYTVIYGVYIRFWPILAEVCACARVYVSVRLCT